MLIYGVYVLSEDPVVFAMNERFLPTLLPLLSADLKPYFLLFPVWTKEPWTQVGRTWWRMRGVSRDRLRWMCSTEREAWRLRAVGFKCHVCHQNAFCNEGLIRPQCRQKRFDAVYVAGIFPYKRLNLAAQVKSLRLIVANADRVGDLPKLGLAHAEVNRQYMNRQEICAALDECRCGLALSAREGGMLAFTEYLLCGLPVVSTPSIGGREAWFTKHNHICCDPDAQSVAAAVAHLLEEGRDPHRIRKDAIELATAYRKTLQEVVCDVGGNLGVADAELDGPWLNGRFVSVHYLPEYLASYDGRRFARRDLLCKFA